MYNLFVHSFWRLQGLLGPPTGIQTASTISTRTVVPNVAAVHSEHKRSGRTTDVSVLGRLELEDDKGLPIPSATLELVSFYAICACYRQERARGRQWRGGPPASWATALRFPRN